MSGMRRGPAGKIQSDSYPELRDELDREATRTKRLPGVKAKGERYQIGHLVEAVLAWYVSQPQEVRDRIVREGREVARGYGAGTGPGGPSGGSGEAAGEKPRGLPARSHRFREPKRTDAAPAAMDGPSAIPGHR